MVNQSSSQKIALAFDKEGHLVSQLPSVVAKDAFDSNFTIPQGLTKGEKDAIKKQLLKKFQNTIDNLINENNEKFYKILWGDEVYNTILKEANSMWFYLKKGERPKIQFHYLPGDKDIDAMLDATPLYKKTEAFNEAKKQTNIQLIFSDPLKHWLIKKYNADYNLSEIKSFENNAKYKRAWADLLKISEQLAAYALDLDSLPKYNCSNNDFDFEKMQRFLQDTLPKNKLYKLFREDSLYKKWIWFTDGNFSVNPVGFTTTDKIYKREKAGIDTIRAGLYDTIIKKMLDSLKQCCSDDPKLIEALVRAYKTGEERFVVTNTYTDPVLGLTGFSDFKNADRIRNKISIPVSDKEKVYILHYNASDNYRYGDNVPKAITEKEKAFAAIHNIPDDVEVFFEQNRGAGIDKSEGEKQVETLADQIGAMVPLINPLSAILSGLKSTFANTTGQVNTNIEPTPAAEAVSGIKTFAIPRVSIPNQNLQLELSRAHVIPAAQYITEYLKAHPASIDPEMVSTILNRCRPLPPVSLTSEESYKTSANNLLNIFYNYVKLNNERVNVMNGIKNNAVVIAAILKLTDRSLPPDPITPGLNENPVFRTQTEAIELSDPPAVNHFTIKEKKAGAKDTTTVVNKKEIRSGKLMLFQLSAGIGVTLADYSAKHASIVNNQIKIENKNDKVRIVAGLHIYPWKLFKQDESFLGFKSHHFKHRVYSYIGVGIPDPLKNYYAGIGADLIPGFKLTIGEHFFLNYRYQLSNNEIFKTNNAVKGAGPFVSFSIEPSTFAKALGLLK